MTFDCIIIGGGISGLTCGIACADAGLKTIIISNGMNALHFSSGSVDLIGYNQNKKVIKDPYKYLPKFIQSNKDHPYAKIGIKNIKSALSFLQDELGKENLILNNNGTKNHFHITILGTKKPTYLSQSSVYNENLKKAFEKKKKIAILNFHGYRDYYARLTVEQLKNQSIMNNIDIITGTIRLPYYTKTEKNLHEFRPIDLARIFDTERYLPRIADEIKKSASDAEIVSFPAFIGINNFNQIHKKLEELTGKLIYEAPALPPSILGMRIDNALKNRFASLGGILSNGDKVVGAKTKKGIIDHIITQNYATTKLKARYYVLSTGSFFSGGLTSSFDNIEEPIFNLKLFGKQKRNNWYSQQFFDKSSHPFLEYGVDTNKNLQPKTGDGKTIKNLFCTGAILSRYNPIKEGSGGGVAVSTGYYAAQKIITEFKKGNKTK